MAGASGVKTRFALMPSHYGSGGVFMELVRWGNPEHSVHRNVWGFAGLAPRISTITPHIGAAAGKYGKAVGTAGFPR